MKKIIYLLLLAYLPCMGGTGVNILRIFPYSENGQLKGYLVISRDVKISPVLKYHISKCDLQMKPIIEIEESRKNTDGIASFAYNQKLFCIAYYTNGNLELNTYDRDLKAYKKIELKSNGSWEKAGAAYSAITSDGESGFILSKYTVKSKQICDFIKYNNELTQVWEYTSSLGFDDEHVTPVLYSAITDKYFYHYSMRKKGSSSANGENGAVLVNNSNDGNLAMSYAFDKAGIKIIEYPAILNGGSSEEVIVAADYINKKEKVKGLALIKMDLKTKKTIDKYIPSSSPDFIAKLDEETKAYVSKGKTSIHPYSVQRLGEKIVVVGELYYGDMKMLEDFGTMNTKAGTLIVMEFDKELNLTNIALQTKSEEASATLVDHSGNRPLDFNKTLLKAVTTTEGVLIAYLDYTEKTTADYCTALYKDGKLIVKRKSLKRDQSNTTLNVYDGANGKVNVVKVTNQFMEVVEE